MANGDEIRGLRTRLVPLLVLGLGLLSTLALNASIAAAGSGRHDQEIRREIDRIREAANEAFRRQVAVLDAVAGAFVADPSFNQAKFDRFYDQLRKGQDASLPEAIGLSLWRPWDRRGELTSEAARRGAKNFRLRPEGSRPEAHAVVLLVPLDQLNALAPGYDMHTEPTRRDAMDLARRRGRAFAAGPVKLVKDPPGSHKAAFILYLPVEGLQGYVYEGVHADKLLKSLFASVAGDHVGLRLFSEGQARTLVYEHPLGEPVVDHKDFELDIPGVGQTLRAEMAVSADFGFPGTIRAWILPVGLIVSLLLFLLAINLGHAHEEARRREAEQSLLAEIGRLTADTAELDDGTLRRIAEFSARFFQAVCRIDLFEADSGLRTISTRTMPDEALATLEREYPRARFDPLFRRALETGLPQRAPHYEAVDERHRALVEPLRAGPILIVPMRSGDRAMGALSYVREPGRSGFSAEAAALAETIAGRVALAVDNARLYRDLERRVEERTRELEASNQELESFCYSVSHDLRTPLRSVDGFGRLLKEDYGDRLDAEGLGYVDRVLAAAKRMDELITALLTLSRLTRREIVPTEVDVSAMAEDQLADLDPDHRIQALVEPGLRVHADPRMLAVLLDNLLGNAVKFSSRKERPTVRVGKTEGGFYVRDNGAGFDMAYAAKLFQPFERLHSPREFPGHGIGLATVDRIVRRHGGEVRAEGMPGEGATFTVRFPEAA